MQLKRSRRSRNRAARKTAGHGSKKKHRGAGHRGGKGNSASGKRSSAKIMKVTKGNTHYLGKYGFKSLNIKQKVINLQDLQDKLGSFIKLGAVSKDKDVYDVNLIKLGYKKLLSKGKVETKMKITIDSATDNAVAKVESAGGSVILEHKE